MASFIEQRLLQCVSYGTEGGPTWSTRRIMLRSKRMRRNAQISRPRYEFVILYSKLKEADHRQVINAFNACRGGAFGFRLKDWSDFEAVDELVTIGTGAPQTIQLARIYEFGSENVSRPIRKPVTGTVVMTQNGGALSSSVDYATGLATFTATNASVVRWSGEFDVPVIFSEDRLSFSFDDRNEAEGFFLTANVPLEEDLDA